MIESMLQTLPVRAARGSSRWEDFGSGSAYSAGQSESAVGAPARESVNRQLKTPVRKDRILGLQRGASCCQNLTKMTAVARND